MSYFRKEESMEEHMFFSKIQQGDTASFEWLYKRYHPRMYMFCKGILHDEDKAKDLVQECFIAFWEHRTQINAPEAISVYPYYETPLFKTNSTGFTTQ